MVITTDGDLLKTLGSIDAFFTEILGGYFFLLLFLIYGVTNWLMWKGHNKRALAALVAGLAVYYVVGIPSYYQSLMEYQTYPWLASQIARLVPQPDPKSGDSVQITVFMPKDDNPSNGIEIYNGLRVRGIDNTQMEAYSQESVGGMMTEKGFIIHPLITNDEQFPDYPALQFNNQEFVIIPVQK
jgi:hypothetical protein